MKRLVILRREDSLARSLVPMLTHPPERILAGKPDEFAFNAFSNAEGTVIAGIYGCAPGKLRMEPYDVDEFCLLLSGVLSITDEGGHENTFTAGDFFIIPRGFSGQWHVREQMRKYYMLFDPQGRVQQRLEQRGYRA